MRVLVRIKLQVPLANQSVSKIIELDKSIVRIKGVCMTSSKDDLMYCRGSQKIEINNKEYYPEDTESKLLMFGINNSKRFDRIDDGNPGNGSVKITYKDEDDGRTVFSHYGVSLYLDCEKQD